MSTLNEDPNLVRTFEQLDIGQRDPRSHDYSNVDQDKTEMREVELQDGGGEVLRLRESNGLLLSRNVNPDLARMCLTFQARPDDVLIATYPKSGTHWVWEIVSMLTRGSDKLLPEPIQHIDFLPVNMLDALPAPRVLATHLPFSRIPRQFLSRGCKVIWVVRNPWDVAVSYFHFLKNLTVFQYDGDWDGFFDLFLDGHVPYNSWFENTLDWLKGMDATANVLLVRYEDLHRDFQKEVQRIADHLNVEVTDAMLDAIQRETAFANMAQNKMDITVPISHDGISSIYRNGTCEDWRNVFSEPQWAELRGAYRVAMGLHNPVLRYSRDPVCLSKAWPAR